MKRISDNSSNQSYPPSQIINNIIINSVPLTPIEIIKPAFILNTEKRISNQGIDGITSNNSINYNISPALSNSTDIVNNRNISSDDSNPLSQNFLSPTQSIEYQNLSPFINKNKSNSDFNVTIPLTIPLTINPCNQNDNAYNQNLFVANNLTLTCFIKSGVIDQKLTILLDVKINSENKIFDSNMEEKTPDTKNEIQQNSELKISDVDMQNCSIYAKQHSNITTNPALVGGNDLFGSCSSDTLS
ncbi:MAG: hypothetical protein K9G11_01695 [Rickettsiaceae bacterium]|nr:hypothetical protein [Rickettsiaceae bacterium]